MDVVEAGRAGGDGEAEGLGQERVHRDGNPVRGELPQDRGKPSLFLRGGDRRRVRVAGGGAQLNDVGAFGSQLAGVRERGCGVEVAAAVGERVLR